MMSYVNSLLKFKFFSDSDKFFTHRSSDISEMKTGTTVKIPPAAKPAKNLNSIRSKALSAKYIKIHPMICGNATEKIVFFRPNLFEAYPKVKVPKKPPIVKTDPINETSSLVISTRRGLSGDCNSGTAAEVQPVDKP